MALTRLQLGLGGVVSMLGGVAFLGATLLVMNRAVHKPDSTRAQLLADVKVDKKKKPPPQKRAPKPKPKPRKSRRPPAPRPAIASNLSGLGVGLALFDSDDMSGFGDELVGGAGLSDDAVMTEEAVDRLPEPSPGNPSPKYPPRARAKGVEGRVVLSLIVGADGAVKSVSVYESEPPGVFDEAVLAVARGWTFSPALYKGAPVQMSFKLPLAFKLN